MLTSHPHHHHSHSTLTRLDSPPHPTRLGSASLARLGRVGAETGADGRMGYGPFGDRSSPVPPRKTASLSLAPSHPKSPPDLFPTFNDFLPHLNEMQPSSSGSKSLKGKQNKSSWQDQATMGLGLTFGDEEDLKRLPLVGMQECGQVSGSSNSFTFDSTRTNRAGDTFTFCPSDSFPSTDSRSLSEAAPTTQATSRSLRSSSPRFKNYHPIPQHSPIAHTLPITPPHTPQRSPSLPLHPSRPVHTRMHSLPPTPPNFHDSYLHLPPPPIEQPYPLSPADTERIAELHNGRTPSLQQLAPPEDMVAAQQPIVNTGNQGPMVVQQGDWACGVCAFVNWRRRKICLRCFPYANDIGNVLTINSQRAASLAAQTHAPPPPPSFSAQAQAPFATPPPLPHSSFGHYTPPPLQYTPIHHHQQPQQQHTFPGPFQHIRSSPVSFSRPPLLQHSSAPTVPRYPGAGGGGASTLPAVIWNDRAGGGGGGGGGAPKGVGTPIARRGREGEEGGAYGGY